ncbi:MAG: SRPBCC domain-containing protein [Ornithinimicrobium sp.]
MARGYRARRTISAPQQRVWELLSDISAYPQWNRAVLEARGKIVEGGKVSLVSTASPKRTFTLTVSELSAPDRMVWTDGMPLRLFQGTRTYTLNRANGATEFSMTEEFTGPLAPLMMKVIPDLTESFEAFAESVKTAAEGG